MDTKEHEYGGSIIQFFVNSFQLVSIRGSSSAGKCL